MENKYPTDVIPLPTKGWFYPEGHPLSSGEIELKQMTAKEEDILANTQLRKNGKFLEKLLESLIVNKSIKQEDILVPDKNAIFLAIRRLAYGDEYPVSITCPSCLEVNRVTINLSTVENKPFDFDSHPKGVNAFDYKLPSSGITVTYKLLNQIDERDTEAELTNFKKLNKDISREYTTRLKYLIIGLDGNADKGAIRKFVDEQLSAKDSLALRKQMRETNPDIDFSFDFVCNNCSHERRQDIPLGLSFLWPDFES
jgi:phage FluMu protein Com